MAVKLRLTRIGKKKQPQYRIVAADARSPRDGRFIDKVGTYDPMKGRDDPSRVVIETEKVQAWLAKGAQPTDRVLRFFDAAGLMKRAPRNNPQKGTPGKKAQERAEARAAKAAPAGEAA